MLLRIFTIATLVLMGGIYCIAQTGADNKSSIYAKQGESDLDNHPKSLREMLIKMRIEKDKKEFDEMLSRGEEAMKISEELEKAYAQNGRLNQNEISKLETVEKLVKKIRSDLGGDDDGSDKRSKLNLQKTRPIAQGEAVKTFRSTTAKLFDELKQTTRFTVSAAAIQSSNAVLRLARFLRISN